MDKGRSGTVEALAAEHILALTGRSITDKDFHAFQKLIQERAGIFLSDAKKALLVGRLNKRLRALGFNTYGDYYNYLCEPGHEDELTQMLDCICTNETRFFREPQHFEYLESTVFPRWEMAAARGKRQKNIRVWSCACSTGEEPYSLAMVLLKRFQASLGWSVEVVASDLSTFALERAMAGVWPIEKARDIPEKYLKPFMLKGVRSQEGFMTAGELLRNTIRFAYQNLNDDRYHIKGSFDLIFCRNVLIYFAPAEKARVINRLAAKLETGGHLFLGHSESLECERYGLRRAVPNVYFKG